MTELELKYGCNPNQKPARIFMEEGELPLKVLNGRPGYINFMDALNSWQLVKALKAATGLPAGLGSPMLDTVEGRLSSLLFGVPAVKGVEFGAGFAFAALRGSHANDAIYQEAGTVKTETNNNGGVNGGITNGMPLVFRVCIKPTPSISSLQQTLNLQTGRVEPLSIHGRHDPCIVTRAAPVVEAACAVALADLLREANGYA